MTSRPLSGRGAGLTTPVSFTWIALFAAFLSPAVHSDETEVYSTAPPENRTNKSGFDDRAAVRIEPSDQKGLRLDLRDLPAHQFLKIEAEIEVAQTPGMEIGLMMMADGRKIDLATAQRNRLQITVDGAKPVVDASFGGMGLGGSFPDLEGDFLHLPGTGSANGPIKFKADDPVAVMGWMGAWDPEKMKKMALHRVTFVVPHTAPGAAIEFAWKTPEIGGIADGVDVIAFAGGNSPFSIMELTAKVLDAPVPLDEAAFDGRFLKLGGEDPVEAMNAFNDLVSAGHSVLPMLRAKLDKAPDPDLEKKFSDAVTAMDDPSFEIRAKATKALSDLGKDVIPLARKVLAEQGDELSVETKSALQNLSDRLEKGSAAVGENAEANRLRRLLDTLGGEEAEKLKKSLPTPKIVIDPDIAKIKDTLLKAMGGGIEMGVPPGDIFGAPDPAIPEPGDGAGGADPFAP